MFDHPLDLLAKIRLGEDTFLELKEVRLVPAASFEGSQDAAQG